MPEFLTTRGVVSRIENIISESKEVLFLISPYLSYIPDSIIIRVKEALDRRVKVVLIFRTKDDIHENEIVKLKTLQGIDIFYNPNLHAKAFYNEREAVITSFNLSGYSEENNIEFGIWITRNDSKEMYEKLISESKIILKTSKLISLTKPPHSLNQLTDGIFDTEGSCIRCNAEIDFNSKKPLCFDCYQIWKVYMNASFKENYCHFCGDEERTSFEEPICQSCLEDLELIVDD